MTIKEFTTLGRYIKKTDPLMFDQLAEIFKTKSMVKIGEKLASIDPEMAEQILADMKEAMLSPLQQTIKANNEWATKMGVTPPNNVVLTDKPGA